ncbi:hypothetical protein [Azotobacter salinestris]|uniref:hypothetical protein n=1 Tax=Azotobacter salinestris TaxID=69964 RepID=UPI0032DED3CB
MLRPIERGIDAHRRLQGLPLLFHVRLKHQGRTLAILSGDSEQEARERAKRLAYALFPADEVLNH